MYLPTTAIRTSCLGCMIRSTISRQSVMSSGLAFRCSRLTRISSSPWSTRRERHLVDAELLVALFDDRLALDVAEQGDLVLVLGRDRVLGPADQDVGLDADLPQGADRVLRRLGLELAGRLQVGDQRQVDVQAVLAADVERELADRFQERQALDVADRAADLGDHHVDVVVGQAADRPP